MLYRKKYDGRQEFRDAVIDVGVTIFVATIIILLAASFDANKKIKEKTDESRETTAIVERH
jgi:hypothetical protein